MAITRGQEITQAQMTALATLANSKVIDGRPYSFGDSGWKDELSRLYVNSFKRIRVREADSPSYLLTGQGVVSEKYPIEAMLTSDEGLECSKAALTESGETTYPIIYDDVDCYFQRSASNKLTFEMAAVAGALVPALSPVSGTHYQSVNYRFSYVFSSLVRPTGSVVRLSGVITWESIGGGYTLSGASADKASITSIGDRFYTATFNYEVTANGLFDFTINANVFQSGQKGVYQPTISGFKITVENSTSTPVTNVISPSAQWETISFNRIKNCLIFPLNGGSYSGNQSVITLRTHNTGGPCLFVGKTFPRFSFLTYDNSFGLTVDGESVLLSRNASQETAENEDWGTVSKSCEYMRPTYHVQAGDVARETIREPDRVLPGSEIKRVYVRIAPTLVGGLYKSVALDSDLVVQIGRVKSDSSFEALASVTIPAGSVEASANVSLFLMEEDTVGGTFVIAQPTTKLAWSAPSDVQVWATVVAPFITSGFGTPYTHNDSSEIEYPIVADHYNAIDAYLRTL